MTPPRLSDADLALYRAEVASAPRGQRCRLSNAAVQSIFDALDDALGRPVEAAPDETGDA